jgi:hypothetical protein
LSTVRERFQAVMCHGDVSKGIPILEWATWWDKPRDAWIAQGVPADASLEKWFGLDMHRQIWIGPRGPQCPGPKHHGAGIMDDEGDYEGLKPLLYQVPDFNPETMAQFKKEQENGDSVLWITLEGPFWFPRTLFGIEQHLYAFYDQPELMKRMNEDLAEFSIRVIDAVCKYYTPDFMTFAEDMSYNHGPMISYNLMDEFMKPYYETVVPELRKRGIITVIDSDGGIEPLIPWFEDAGIEGILPLARMAGVDVCRIRRNHPKWKMVGGFDKTVMHLGEEALRKEFERIRPAVEAGYYIPSCDHQTPPAVTIDDYRLYVRLLKEFSDSLASDR